MAGVYRVLGRRGSARKLCAQHGSRGPAGAHTHEAPPALQDRLEGMWALGLSGEK